MKTIEEELKELIIGRYGTILDFSKEVGLSNSSVVSILRRGVRNSGADNLLKICEKLHISADGLGIGKIIDSTIAEKKDDSKHDLIEIVTLWKLDIVNFAEIDLVGIPLTDEERADIIDSIDLCVNQILRKRKRRG